MNTKHITRSELAQEIYAKGKFSQEQTEPAVRCILEMLTDSLSRGQRVEIRGFGAFSVKTMPSRNAHNPKTGKKLVTEEKARIHFKPGKELKERVIASMATTSISEEEEE